MDSEVENKKIPAYLVKFSEDLMEVISTFKEEMEILADEELVKAIKLSEENSKKKNTKIMSIEELKDELGL